MTGRNRKTTTGIQAEIHSIDTDCPILFPALRAARPRKRLWLGAGCVAAFLATLAGSGLLHRNSCPPPLAGGPARTTLESNRIGLDFLAFYTAGRFVGEGRAEDLYNLPAVRGFQRDLCRRNGIEFGSAIAPWWNPPFYAWAFVPLARLPFEAALSVWLGINLACFAAGAWLLCRMLPPGGGWRTAALVPLLMALSVPFLHAFTHGQNTCTSLLLLALTVTAWRRGRALTAGLVAGLMFYKPQLAAVLALALIASLGWRAAAGLALTGSALLLVTLTTLPGALGQFLHQMPLNLHAVQTGSVYNWERHVTLRAFWRLLLQGNSPGEASHWADALFASGTAAVAVAWMYASPLQRWMKPLRYLPHARPSIGPRDELQIASQDRFIAATVAATPLLMPFYFDYDLLLLAVPAVLFAAEWSGRDSAGPITKSDRWLLALWPALYAWLLVNADVADHTRLNLAVPLLTGVVSLLIARAARREPVVTSQGEPATPLAKAA